MVGEWTSFTVPALIAAISRAMPRYESRSGRLEVTSTSNIVSPGMYSLKTLPTGASGGRMSRPSASSASASSFAEQSMPWGELAAQLRLLDHEVAGQLRAGQSERDLVALLEVLRAADDLAQAVAVIDLAEAQTVGVGMLDERDDLADDEVRRVDAGRGDVLDLGAGERELVQHLRHGHGEIKVVAEPAKGEFHGAKMRGASMPGAGAKARSGRAGGVRLFRLKGL